ncbi:MAG: hypothetical protein ACFNLN_04215, partial [Treponema socranskii subsp. buccale]
FYRTTRICDPALRGSLTLGLLARLRSLRWLPAAPLRPGVGLYLIFMTVPNIKSSVKVSSSTGL